MPMPTPTRTRTHETPTRTHTLTRARAHTHTRTNVPAALAAPQPAPPVALPQQKKVVDSYVIILACVLGGLLVLPALAWLARRCYLARQHRKVGSGARQRATGPGGQEGRGRVLGR